jgi:hypothetical protein
MRKILSVACSMWLAVYPALAALAISLLVVVPRVNAGTWSLVQVKDATSCSNPCAITVTSTGSGNQAVVFAINGDAVTIGAITSAGTWTHPTGGGSCANGNATTGFVDCSYIASLTSGVTSISVPFTGTTINSMSVYYFEFSSTGSPAFDVSGSSLTTTACTSCPGVALSLTGTNDAIATIASCGGTCSAVGSPYSSQLSFLNGNGFADALNTTNGRATWTQTSGEISTAAVAFKDTSSGSTKVCTLAATGAGLC